MTRGRRRRAWSAAVLLAVLCGAGLLVGRNVRRIEQIRAGVTAKQMCSCIFVDGRDEAGCRSDVPPIYDAVRVAVDQQTRAVQAWVPIVAYRTAAYRDGSGCTLQ
jgi:hypothetical protein